MARIQTSTAPKQAARAKTRSTATLASSPTTPSTTAFKSRRARSKETSVVQTPAPAVVPVSTTQPVAPSGNKLTRITALLRRPEGATVAELMQVTGWLSHSVRGALSGALKRKQGLTIASSVEPDLGRVYRIVDPDQPAPVQVSEPERNEAATPAPAKRVRSKRQPSTAGASA